MDTLVTDDVDADERRFAALSQVLRLYAEAGQRSDRAGSAEDRNLAERETEALGELVRAVAAVE